jgi:hypothetical protein
MTIYDKIRGQDYSGGDGSLLNLGIAKKISDHMPEIEIQSQLIVEIENKLQVFEGLRKMKSEAEHKIEKILAEVWGVETKKQEVRDGK